MKNINKKISKNLKENIDLARKEIIDGMCIICNTEKELSDFLDSL